MHHTLDPKEFLKELIMLSWSWQGCQQQETTCFSRHSCSWGCCRSALTRSARCSGGCSRRLEGRGREKPVWEHVQYELYYVAFAPPQIQSNKQCTFYTQKTLSSAFLKIWKCTVSQQALCKTRPLVSRVFANLWFRTYLLVLLRDLAFTTFAPETRETRTCLRYLGGYRRSTTVSDLFLSTTLPNLGRQRSAQLSHCHWARFLL